jgi:hypothetical protein
MISQSVVSESHKLDADIAAAWENYMNARPYDRNYWEVIERYETLVKIREAIQSLVRN